MESGDDSATLLHGVVGADAAEQEEGVLATMSTSSLSKASWAYLDQDMALMREGLRLILTNRFCEAEELFARAAEETQARTVNLEAGDHDHQGAFAFLGALASVVRGLATLEDNQLVDTLARLRNAENLCNLDTPWAGRTVLNGFCVLLIGVVQTLQGSLTQGVWNMLRSWRWLKNLESEALDYDGPGREMVRSAALLALGVFNLIISFLPPYFMSTANWLSGFSGNRSSALDTLRTCWEEDGLLAPFAALALIGYQVDVRTFLGEPHSGKCFTEAREILDWAAVRFPDGIFFRGLEANYFALCRDVGRALEISDGMASLAEEYKALNMVMRVRRASYAQANLDWESAAQSFHEALEVYRAQGRRSLIPAMAMNAALCHKMAGNSEHEEEMLGLVLEYKARADKKDWSAPDLWAFDLVTHARKERWEPELELIQLMTLKHRSTLFMSIPKVKELLAMLQQHTQQCGPSDEEKRCRCLFLQAELLRQLGSFDEALQVCEEGFALQPFLGELGNKGGWVQYLCFVRAASCFYRGDMGEAKEALRKLGTCPRNHDLYKSVSFKAAELGRRLGLEMKEAYTEVVVAGRSMANFEVRVPDGTDFLNWDFVLADYSINFVVAFQSDNGGDKVEVQRLEKHEANDGPAGGSFKPPGSGTLFVVFDNSFSLLRGKTVLFRIQPEHLELLSTKSGS